MNEILNKTFETFGRNFKYIFELSFPFICIGFLAYFVGKITDPTNSAVVIAGIIAYLIGFATYMSTMVFFVSQEYRGELQPVSRNLINGLVFAPPMMLILILANLPILASVLLLMGPDHTKLLMFPMVIIGIYVSLKCTFAPFHLILEGNNPLESVKASFATTTGKLLKIVAILILFYLATNIINMLTGPGEHSELAKMGLFFLGITLTMLATTLEFIAMFRLYLTSFQSTAVQMDEFDNQI